MNIPTEGHVVNICPPIDWNDAAKTADAFSMENYSHVDIIVTQGVVAAATTVTVEECTSAAGAGNTAIGFDYYAETTAAGDTFIGFFLAGLIRTGQPAEAIEEGCRAAALCVTRHGAANSIPQAHELKS